jgi:hypothetical protein
MADIERARQLRKAETWAEKLMWRWLRDRRFSGYKFRRQQVRASLRHKFIFTYHLNPTLSPNSVGGQRELFRPWLRDNSCNPCQTS